MAPAFILGSLGLNLQTNTKANRLSRTPFHRYETAFRLHKMPFHLHKAW